MNIKRCILIGLLAVSATVAVYGRTWFTNGYGRQPQVRHQSELVARLNQEAQAIASALLEADVMQGTKISVFISDGNSNGFETKFECEDEQKALLTADDGQRAQKVENALIARYEELAEANLASDQIGNRETLPLRKYVEKIRSKKG